MGTTSYPSMTQPFSMSHSASNMTAAVAGMRQDAMGKFYYTFAVVLSRLYNLLLVQ